MRLLALKEIELVMIYNEYFILNLLFLKNSIWLYYVNKEDSGSFVAQLAGAETKFGWRNS